MSEEEDTVIPQEEVVESQVEQPDVEPEEATEKEHVEQQVPFSALKKERRRRQEAEIENRILKEQQTKRPEQQSEPEESRYESATKDDLSKNNRQLKREIAEEYWISQNPEKYERVREQLPELLKRRPNLAAAIEQTVNRYEEAWDLMTALSPKEQQNIKQKIAPKKDAPGSPSGVPKSAVINQAVDVMSMSDTEFSQWRQAQKRNR